LLLSPDADSKNAIANAAAHYKMIPPAIEIKAPPETDSNIAEISVSVKDRFHPVSSLAIVINGRLLGHDELKPFKSNVKMEAHNTRLIVKERVKEFDFTIPLCLDAGSNRIQVFAVNSTGNTDNLGAEGRKTVYTYNTSEENAREQDLWIMAVGANSYLSGPEFNLKFSANNASGIVKLFAAQNKKRYNNIHTMLITENEETKPTRNDILLSFNKFFQNAKPNDVLILFLSGHGEDDKTRGYCFLPEDTQFTPGGRPDLSNAISLEDFDSLLDMPGRKFLFIDSCYSGGADNGKLAQRLKNPSTAIFTSSQRTERSREGSAAIGYGIFTESLIAGLRGKAAVNNEIKLNALTQYVNTGVFALSSGEQNPYIYIPEGLDNFIIAEAEEEDSA
jgi:hypothetical protein